MITKVLGDGANYLTARSLLSVGDIQIQRKEWDAAEKTMLRAQTMIAEKFSENHPCITEYNSNLLEVYSNKSEEEEKAKTVQIAEKNLEIAQQYYGEDSIYVVRHELALASNKIGALMLSEAQDNIASIRKIVQRFHDDNPRDLMN